MFENFPQDEIQIIGSDGKVRSTTNAMVHAAEAILPDGNVQIFAGDEIRRTLPNGVEEAFEVIDPVFCKAFHGITAHYQVKIRRKGQFPKGQGGNYVFNLSGPNSRVNINSQDNSQNIVSENSVFNDIKKAIENGVQNSDEKEKILALISAMEKQASDKGGFLKAYQEFMASLSNHVSIIAPFLPALSKYFS